MLVNAEFMKHVLVETYSYEENLGEMGMHRCQKGTRIVRDGWRWACLIEWRGKVLGTNTCRFK